MTTQGVCLGNQKAYLVSKPLPTIGDGFVLIKPQYAGICGSDLHALHQPESGSIRGHEIAGVVEKVGGESSQLQVGQKVHPSLPA